MLISRGIQGGVGGKQTVENKTKTTPNKPEQENYIRKIFRRHL